MANFILIFFCMSLGIIFRLRKIFPDSTAQVLNRFVIYISLPALTLKALHQISMGAEHVPLVAMAWGLFFLGIIFFTGAQYFIKMPRKTFGTLILTGSLGNTSFVGFPLLEALFGTGAIATGVLVDQPGTFLVAGTLGIFVASLFSSQRPTMPMIFKKIVFFPPFQAVVLSFLLHPFVFPQELDLILDKLAATLIPLSLVAVGFQLKIDGASLKQEWKNLVWGLGFKLFLAPLIMGVVYIGCFKMTGQIVHIVLVESAMAPMITAGILATEYNLNSELASLMIGVGIPLSMLTVPLWSYVFSYFV